MTTSRIPPATAVPLQLQLRLLASAVPQASLGDGGAVHRARVASRRLREVLPVAVGGRTRASLNRAVRRLTRALGPVREVDVTLAILTASMAEKAVSRRAGVALKQALVRRRAEVRQVMRRELERVDLARLEKDVMTATRKTPRLKEAQGRLARRAGLLSVAVEEAAGLYVPERLHEVRIAVKKLRYADEVLTAVTGARPGDRLRFLKRVQDVLGRMHDLDVLAAAVRQLQGADAPPSLGVCADLDRFVRTLDGECRRLHGQYMSLRDRLLRTCAETAGVAA